MSYSPFFRKPVEQLAKWVPVSWKKYMEEKVKAALKEQCTETDEQLRRKTESFLFRQGMLFFWGLILLGMVCFTVMVLQQREEQTRIKRNPFGAGQKAITLQMKKEKKEKKYTLLLSEQRLSATEEEKLKKKFFQQLERKIRGKNLSLKKVDRMLSFPDMLAHWPFYITYVPEKTEVIRMDGSLGEKGKTMKEGDYAETALQVTAEYGDYRWRKTFLVRVVPPKENPEEAVFARAAARLQQEEKKTRNHLEYILPGEEEGVLIRREKESLLPELFFSGLSLLSLVIVHGFFSLKEGEKKCRKETLKDFPTIVHLLTLYMGAGLSLASAVERIATDYQGDPGRKKRYAFEELLRMDRQLKLGTGQKEACMQWGKRFKEPVYQKLALMLLQVTAKGSREGRLLMEQMEREAFRYRLDMAKKEGEEAATKLLFPMILLLCMVMILVMFPAILRFQGI